MTRPVLPDGIRRVPISVSLSPGVIALVDQMIADGEASTRSRAVEQAITFWAGTPAPSPKRKARK